MPKPLPIVDIQPGDLFEVFLSQRTGYFRLNLYRRVRGAGYSEETLLEIFPTQREAMTVRNRLRNEEGRIRAERDWEDRQRVYGALDAQAAQAVAG